MSNDNDDDSDPLSIVDATDPTHGTVEVAVDGSTLSYEADANYHGPDSFEYTITDGSDTDTAEVGVTVTSVNDRPSAVNDSRTVAEDANATAMNVLTNDFDVDGDDVTVTAVSDPPHGTAAITGNGANLTYRPNLNYSGPDSFTYTIDDGDLTDTATVTITVTSSNDQPSAVADSRTIGEDANPTLLNVLVNDTDPDSDALSISDVGTPSHGDAVIVGGGSDVTYRPDANYNGPDSFSYEIEDGHGGTDTATVSLSVTSVNDAPNASPDTRTVAEDAGPTAVNVLSNDTDVDGDTLAITAVTQGAKGAVAITGGGSGVTYDPAPNQTGPDSFTYTISDGHTSDATTVSVSITASNDDPVADADSITVLEDANATGVPVLVGDTDPDGDVLAIEGASNPAHGTVVVAGNDLSLTYKPDPNYFGPDTFTYTVSDGNGGSDTATVTVTVTSVNDDPVADADSITVPEDAAATGVPVLVGDSDIDGDDLTIDGASNPAHGTVVVAGDGLSLTYKPDLNYFGPDTFTYTVSDGHGGTAVGPCPLPSRPSTIHPSRSRTVSPWPRMQRSRPFCSSPTTRTSMPARGAWPRLEPRPRGRRASRPGMARFGTHPTPDATGLDSFSYTLIGGSVTTVSVTITPANDDPVAAPNSLSIPAGASPVPVPVLANDTDVDGDALRVTAKTNGAKGAVVIGNGGTSIAYQPFPGLFGSDSFTYTIGDGHGGTDLGTVSVTITSGNHPPNAVNDARDIPQGAGATPLTILANDQDADGNTLTITAKTNGAHGAVAHHRRRYRAHLRPGPGLSRHRHVHVHDQRRSGLGYGHGAGVTVVRDAAAPIVIAPAERFPGHTVGSSTTKARLAWSASDQGSGIKRYKLQVSVDGGAWKTIALPKATSRTIVRSLTTGHTYQFRMRAMDGEGNVSAYVKGPLLKPTRFSEASTRVTYTGAWAKTKTTKALGGATRHATASTKRARFTFTALDVGWIASTTTKSGKARIFVDGTLVATIDLDRTTTKYRKLVFARHFPTLAPHTLEIQPVGDGRVDIDGFVILR